jgi:hypothetical protein
MSRCCYEFECKALDEITSDEQPKNMDSCPYRTLQKAANDLRDQLNHYIVYGYTLPKEQLEALIKTYEDLCKGGSDEIS